MSTPVVAGSDVARMRAAARTLIDSIDSDGRRALLFDLDDAVRTEWDYRPRREPGLSLSAIDEPARQLVQALVAAGTSAPGFERVTEIMALESVLDRIEGGHGPRRDPLGYAVCIFGEPRERGVWAWRFEGHHVSLNVMVAGEAAVAAPSFLGANPARSENPGGVPRRPLGDEEDVARAIIEALDSTARAQAILSPRAPADILTSNDSFVRPAPDEGAIVADMPGGTRAMVARLLEVWAVRLPPEVARRELDRLAGRDGDELRFAWAGGVRPGEGHWYRLSGPHLLLEYDNTQNGANHVHSVWRDPEGDFGRDLLREHLGRDH